MCVCVSVCARICFLGGLPAPRPRIAYDILVFSLATGPPRPFYRQVGKSKHRIERKRAMPNESALKLTRTNEAGSRQMEADENG